MQLRVRRPPVLARATMVSRLPAYYASTGDNARVAAATDTCVAAAVSAHGADPAGAVRGACRVARVGSSLWIRSVKPDVPRAAEPGFPLPTGPVLVLNMGQGVANRWPSGLHLPPCQG